MSQIKTQWGFLLFLCAIIVTIATVPAAIFYPPQLHTHFYLKVLPILGIVFSIMSFFIGHFSYPRVHNLKVYLIGYITGIFSLSYFIFYHFPSPPFLVPMADGFIIFLYLFIFANILLVELVPSFVKYRTARHLVLAIIPIECILLLIARISPKSLMWTTVFSFERLITPAFLLGILIFLLALFFSLWRIKNEFSLGGILAGLAFFYAFAWLARVYLPILKPLELLTFTLAPFYLEAGILIHWFARMEYRIAYDPLLHIYNRDYCGRIISEQSSLNLLPPLSVVMVDIDHFKSVNDNYGHQAGDQVLYSVAQTICKEVLPDGVVCRYGGEELIIFFPQKTLHQTLPLVENMRLTLEKVKTKTSKKIISVSVSCGVSCREQSAQSITEVIKAADKALYKAKESGRNQVKSSKTVSAFAKKQGLLTKQK
jgi:diguanylate cyclase (GGDEF)-like protein